MLASKEKLAAIQFRCANELAAERYPSGIYQICKDTKLWQKGCFVVSLFGTGFLNFLFIKIDDIIAIQKPYHIAV